MIPEDLLTAATAARAAAYAPYSGYAVGSALRTTGGQVFSGCNFENISYGATICAERNAVGAMILAGERRIIELVVITEDAGTPCGICLCVLGEFCDSTTKIYCTEPGGTVHTFEFQELCPHLFTSTKVALAPGP